MEVSIGTNCDFRRIAGYRSMTAAVRTASATVQPAVYRTPPRISESMLITAMHYHDEEMRTEQNLSVRSGKSDA